MLFFEFHSKELKPLKSVRREFNKEWLLVEKEKRMSLAIKICFLIVGLINFIPIVGVLSDQRLNTLYGISISSPELSILLKHRAILFGMLGGFILFAAFSPSYRPLAFILGYISMISFLLIALTSGNYNQEITKVVIADIVGIAVFAVATVLHFLEA